MKSNFNDYCVEMEDSLRELLARGMDEYKKFTIQKHVSKTMSPDEAKGAWAKMLGEFKFPVCWRTQSVMQSKERVAELMARAEEARRLDEDSVVSVVPEAYATAHIEELLRMEPQNCNVVAFPSNVEVLDLMFHTCCSALLRELSIERTKLWQVDDIVFRLLSQESSDETLKVFGGVVITEYWVAGSENRWVEPLQQAINSANAASQLSSRLKARRSTVNSRWRDALVKVTSY